MTESSEEPADYWGGHVSSGEMELYFDPIPRPEEGVIEAGWKLEVVEGDSTFVRVDTYIDGELFDSRYGDADTDIYPFNGVELPGDEIDADSVVEVRVSFGSGFDDDSWSTSLEDVLVAEKNGSEILPNHMRVDYSESGSAEMTMSYSQPGEFIWYTDWNVEVTGLDYDAGAGEVVAEVKAWYEQRGGYVEGFSEWLVGVSGVEVEHMNEPLGGAGGKIEWSGFDTTDERNELRFPAEPGDFVNIQMYAHESDVDVPGDHYGYIAFTVPEPEPDVELVGCDYSQQEVTVGETVELYLTLENHRSVDSEVDITISEDGVDASVDGVLVPGGSTEDVELEITPNVAGDYDFDVGLDARVV